MHKGLVIIGLLFLLLASCTDDRKVQELLDRAEGYLPDEVDSAYTILQTVSTPTFRGSGERVRSLYGLLRTTADAMQGKGVTADSLIRPAYEYYKEQVEAAFPKSFPEGTDLDLMRLGRSAFYLAQFEASRDSTKRAEDLFREAIRCSEQVEDWRTCYLAYNHFAKSITWSNTELAIELRKKAINIYNRCKDKPANYISILNSLSNDYLSVGFADSAFNCTNEAYKIACDYQLEEMKYASLRALSNLYFETGDDAKALELAKQGMQGLTVQTRTSALFSLADCYLACDSLEQAKSILLNISSSDNKMRYAVFRKLSQIAMLQHESQLAVSYSDSAYQAVVCVFSESQYQKNLYYENLLDEELANERLTHHNQTLRYGVIIIILIVIILVLISYRSIKRYISRLNENHRLSMLSQETLISELHARIDQFNKQVTQNEQSLNQYQKLLEQKQKELQQLKLQEINTQEQQSKQQQYVQEISVLQQRYLREKEKSQKIKAESQQVITQMQQYVISRSKPYRQIVNHKILYTGTDQQFWQDVEQLLDACSYGFATRLKKEFPKMTDEQYHLCMMNRMGLNREQIASFMCLAGVTIKKKHQECKRSIFGTTDSTLSFNDLIAKF